ncbi:MAG TPA: YafY family protein [Thermomicrobiales bacterium]|jgi:predicted DNA-binding transcriptional regulator YafY
MRADRLLSILLLLQVHRRLTAGELAARLEVSERTIHRDMDALSSAGVPVYAQRGAGGGWALTDGFRTNATGLTETEIRTLFLGNPSRLLADLGLGGAAEAALIKLLAAIPSPHRRGAEDVRQRIHIDVGGWHPGGGEPVPALPVLQEAIWSERRVRLTYQPQTGEPRERLVDPLGLVAQGSTWYLVAAVDGGPRTYRVSRVLAVRPTEEPFVRPEAFDLPAYWESSKADFVAGLPRYRALVRADPTLLPRLAFLGRFARVERTDPPDPDGWVPVEIRFQFEEDAVEAILGYGPRIEVIDPPELCDLVISRARATMEWYAAAPRSYEALDAVAAVESAPDAPTVTRSNPSGLSPEAP